MGIDTSYGILAIQYGANNDTDIRIFVVVTKDINKTEHVSKTHMS